MQRNYYYRWPQGRCVNAGNREINYHLQGAHLCDVTAKRHELKINPHYLFK